MRERYYKLDPKKTKGLQAKDFTEWNISRQRIWAWLQGDNGIPETYFNRLLTATGKRPAELLDQESLEFFANASISA